MSNFRMFAGSRGHGVVEEATEVVEVELEKAGGGGVGTWRQRGETEKKG